MSEGQCPWCGRLIENYKNLIGEQECPHCKQTIFAIVKEGKIYLQRYESKKLLQASP